MTRSQSSPIPSLASYSLLGRSGLRVSPLCLGTMTFGTATNWGADEATSRQVFQRYLEAGGNFVDTADLYTGGQSEEMLGKFLREQKNREAVVLATKYTFAGRQGDPNAGGNGRKHLLAALEASLRRLQTDHIDLYWLHAWDRLTPIEEVMSTLDAAVRAGKVLHIGLSDTPAWYVARAQTLAEWRGWERVCALQLEYSLVERGIEFEHVPAALELGLGILPWSPLAMGLLAGKYRRGQSLPEGRIKATQDVPNPVFNKLTEHNLDIAETLIAVAAEVGRSPAQVALNWITKRPGVTSTIIGATKMSQLEDNLAALEFDIPEALSARLEEVSRPQGHALQHFFSPSMRGMFTGGTQTNAEPAWYRPR